MGFSTRTLLSMKLETIKSGKTPEFRNDINHSFL